MLTKILFLFFTASLIGCRSDERLPTYPVTGRVILTDGSPLAGGWIICHSARHGLAARGVIEPDGRYSLGTYEPRDGALAGNHLVAITPANPPGHDPDQGAALPAIHRRFMHMETSGLQLQVEPDMKNHFELTVEPP